MQSTNLYPAAQNRDVNQVQNLNSTNVVTTYSPYVPVQQVHHVGQQVFSTPLTPPNRSYHSFPPVMKVHSQPTYQPIQPSFPIVQQWPPQPTNHNVVQVTPQFLGQNNKPLFPANQNRF